MTELCSAEGDVGRKINKRARLHLMDLLGPRELWAVAYVCDQTWAYLKEEIDCDPFAYEDTLSHKEAKLFTSKADAQGVIDRWDARHERWLQDLVESGVDLNEYWTTAKARAELLLDKENREGRPWLWEVHDDPRPWVKGEASFRAQPDTW